MQSKKWIPWAVTLAMAIALPGAIPPVTAQTNPPPSAELGEAEALTGQVFQLYKQGNYK